MPTKTPGEFTVTINHHTISGRKRRGRWTFTCPSWPDLEVEFRAVTDCTPAIAEFSRRALAGSVRVLRALRGK